MAVYVFTDIHGRYSLWEQIKNYLKPNDIAYCLGDCIDRGPDGIKILQEIQKNKRIKMLLGNHEELLLEYISIGMEKLTKTDKELIASNETEKTLFDFYCLSIKDQNNLFKWIQNLPIYIIYNTNDKQYFLSHAGGDPDKMPLKDKNALIYYLLWDRKHLKTKHWNLKKYPNLYMIHGHSPVGYLNYLGNKEIPPYIDKITYYCDKHKIDLDLLSVNEGKIALLNLDTLEEKYFFDKK